MVQRRTDNPEPAKQRARNFTQRQGVAIIGTRRPDPTQITVAATLAMTLTNRNVFVKTGGALGVDEAAMGSADPRRLVVYLPWHGFNRTIIPKGSHQIVLNTIIHQRWMESVKKYHPAPHRLGEDAMKLMARNFGIIADLSVAPTLLVVALPDERGARGVGGTMQGVRIANALGFPVIQGNKGTISDPDKLIASVLDHEALK